MLPKEADIELDYVSILILLEVPLQPTFLQVVCYTSYSFNPYFTGSTTSTKQL